MLHRFLTIRRRLKGQLLDKNRALVFGNVEPLPFNKTIKGVRSINHLYRLNIKLTK